MRIFQKSIMTLTLLALLTAVPAASAHRPEEGIDGGLTPIPDPTTSFAYYRDFAPGAAYHLYAVEATAGQEFHAGINIPQLEGLENYGVTLAVFGPGLPDVSPADLPAASSSSARPQTAPTPLRFTETPELADVSGLGGVIVENQVTGDFFEPFTQTNYWGRQSLDILLPESGTYYVAVWQPDELPGKYVLDTGRQEVFSPGDFLRFPVWWWNTRSYFDQLPNLWTPALAALGGLGLVTVLRRKLAAGTTRE